MIWLCFGPIALLTLRLLFFFNDTATTEIYTLSLHDALPISCAAIPRCPRPPRSRLPCVRLAGFPPRRSPGLFWLPGATMTRRITRAKQAIKDSALPFAMPAGSERAQRLAAVLHVLSVIFTEAYAAPWATGLVRAALSAEAIGLTRLVHRQLPQDGEVTGLLSLMLLNEARRPARAGPDGDLIPMAEQDRSRWDTDQIAEGVALITGALSRGSPGPYQLQAAIAAVHDEAATAEATDWPQIVALYELLLQLSDNPVVALNRAVAVAMVRGPRAGLDLLAPMQADQRITGSHRFHAVRAHLLEMAGDRAAARTAYLDATGLTASLPHQRYLHAQVTRLGGDA